MGDWGRVHVQAGGRGAFSSPAGRLATDARPDEWCRWEWECEFECECERECVCLCVLGELAELAPDGTHASVACIRRASSSERSPIGTVAYTVTLDDREVEKWCERPSNDGVDGVGMRYMRCMGTSVLIARRPRKRARALARSSREMCE